MAATGTKRGTAWRYALQACVVASALSNVATVALLLWFLTARPYVRTDGYATVSGEVDVRGSVEVINPRNGTLDVRVAR